MKVIGLCGGSGSGKGAVSRILSEYGIPTLDTDALYRELTSRDGECMRALTREFGESVATPEGALNRIELRKLVFSGVDKDLNREKLNKITHAYILDAVRQRLAQYEREGKELAVIDAPLLFESGFDKECDLTVAVMADRGIRIKRICERDGLTREAAENRINTQISDEKLSSMVNFVITNSASRKELAESVAELVAKIKKTY